MISIPSKQLSLLALSVLTATLFTACSSNDGQGKQNSKHGLINTPPVAQEANLTLKEDNTLSITLQATDVDKDTLGYKVATPPKHGKLTGTAPKLVYTPNKDYNGEDSFTFIANDGQADSTPTKITLSIAPINDAPAAKDDAISLEEDTNTTIEPLSNDTDIDGDALSIKSFTQPQHGTLTQKEKTLVYAPNQDYNGEDSFSYTLTDGKLTSQATAALSITPINDAPIAQELNATLNENETTNITLKASDVDSQNLTYKITKEPTNGKLTGAPPNITYAPNKDFFGDESFAYIATDDKGAKSQETLVSITVNEHDITPPVITMESNETLTVKEGSTFVPPAATVTDNRDTNLTYTIDGTVDTSKPGDYTLTYKTEDTSGNKAQKSIKVIVEEDLTIQKITQDGNLTKATRLILASEGGEIVFDDGVKLTIGKDILREDTLISVSKDDNNTHFKFEPNGMVANGNMELSIPITDEAKEDPAQIVKAIIFSDESPEYDFGGKNIKAEILLSSFLGDLPGDKISLQFSHFSLVSIFYQDTLYISMYLPTKYLKKGDVLIYLSSENYEVNPLDANFTKPIENENYFDWFPGHTAMISSPEGEPCNIQGENINTCNMIESMPNVVREYNLYQGYTGANYDGHIFMGARRLPTGALTTTEGNKAVKWAKSQVGVDWGFANIKDANGKYVAFSCVGFVDAAYESVGKDLAAALETNLFGYLDEAHYIELPLQAYRNTVPVDHITEKTGSSVKFRVNPVFAYNNSTYNVTAYGDYRLLSAYKPTHFLFEAKNLPDGATFDSETGMFEWNNIPENYAGKTHKITFELQADFTTGGGGFSVTTTKKIAQDLAINIENGNTDNNSTGGGDTNTTDPTKDPNKVCVSNYFQYYGDGKIHEDLKKGDKDEGVSNGTKHQVKELQEFLQAFGYNVGSSGADGWFGTDTKNALIEFQSNNGLDADGIVGPNTRDAMNSANCYDK